MINKFYKIINNKFSRFFKFIFFLRYLFVIFFVAIVLFLIIPQFFDYKKKELVIFSNLSKSYGLEIKKIEGIKFKSFPTPHLQIDNLSANFLSSQTKLDVKKLLIFPKLMSVYNYNNFEIRKIKFLDSLLQADIKKITLLNNRVFNSNQKMLFENLNIKIKEVDNTILDLKNVNFSNYGFYRNQINGNVFNKSFRIKLIDNLRNIHFELIDAGLSATLNLLDSGKMTPYSGIFKGNILKSNFKIDFIYLKDSIQINKFFFRGKKLSFDSKGSLDLLPFFKINLTSEIKNFDTKNIKNVEIEKFLDSKKILKKLHIEKKIIFKSKKLRRDLIDNLNLKFSLAYGRLNFSKKLIIDESKFDCSGSINFLEEFPVLDFRCKINSSDKKKLLKKIDINFKKKNEPLYLDVKGYLNLLNNKINFDHIKMNSSYIAKMEDLKYFKSIFENILFDNNFLNIFDLAKIKKFVLEIS